MQQTESTQRLEQDWTAKSVRAHSAVMVVTPPNTATPSRGEKERFHGP